MVETSTTETIKPTTNNKNATGPGLTNVSSNKHGSSAGKHCQREKAPTTLNLFGQTPRAMLN
jgi:hypothetical protein